MIKKTKAEDSKINVEILRKTPEKAPQHVGPHITVVNTHIWLTWQGSYRKFSILTHYYTEKVILCGF